MSSAGHTFDHPGYLRRAMEAGASGFLVKDGPVEDLAAAIRRVLAGHRVIDPALAAAALSTGPSLLTPREQDVLNAAADGATVADIAARVRLSESTVRNHLSAAIGKTGTRNRMEAVLTARHKRLALTSASAAVRGGPRPRRAVLPPLPQPSVGGAPKAPLPGPPRTPRRPAPTTPGGRAGDARRRRRQPAHRPRPHPPRAALRTCGTMGA